MNTRSVLVDPTPPARAPRPERRASVRHVCELEALSRPLDLADTICWGATVRDISAGGVGLQLCYPFQLGTLLAVDVRNEKGRTRTLLVRVIHVTDQADGTWFLGCELVTPLREGEL